MYWFLLCAATGAVFIGSIVCIGLKTQSNPKLKLGPRHVVFCTSAAAFIISIFMANGYFGSLYNS